MTGDAKGPTSGSVTVTVVACFAFLWRKSRVLLMDSSDGSRLGSCLPRVVPPMRVSKEEAKVEKAVLAEVVEEEVLVEDPWWRADSSFILISLPTILRGENERGI